MESRIRDMTAGRPAPLLFRFALPLMIGNAFQQLYTVVDTAVVGKALGVDALAALGATDWLNWLILGIIQGLTQGASILMAQEFGARRYESLRQLVGNAAACTLLFSLFLTALGQLAARPVLQLMETPDEIIGNSLLYLRIIYGGVPVVMAYNLLASILRALGDGKTPLYAMIAASLLNIALDLLFVLVFHWGFAGAAAATLIAQVVAGLYCLRQIGRVEFLRLRREHFSVRLRTAWSIARISWPLAFMWMIVCVGGVIVQKVVNGFGVVFIAGFTATNKLYGILEVASVSYGYSVTTYVGQNLGAGRMDRVRKGVRAAAGIALLTSVVIAAVTLVFGRFILSCFISGPREQAAQALEIAYTYLFIMSVFLPVLYMLYVTRSALQGMGNTVLPLVSGVAEFLMRTASALLLPRLLGNIGIFFAEIFAWTGALVVLTVSYFIMVHRLSRTLPPPEAGKTGAPAK